jgi:hypothetical protein
MSGTANIRNSCAYGYVSFHYCDCTEAKLRLTDVHTERKLRKEESVKPIRVTAQYKVRKSFTTQTLESLVRIPPGARIYVGVILTCLVLCPKKYLNDS